MSPAVTCFSSVWCKTWGWGLGLGHGCTIFRNCRGGVGGTTATPKAGGF